MEPPDIDALQEILEEDPGDDKVVNLAVYKIKKSLKEEGFDLITDDKGKLTLVLRLPGR